MQTILIILAIYLGIGAAVGAFILWTLWGIGNFSLPKEEQQNPFRVFFRMMFLWGTIPFRKRSGL